MTRWLTIAVLGLAACSGNAPNATLTGTFTLNDRENVRGDWNNCWGAGGYDDFAAGMNVTIRDQDGKIVGTGDARALGPRDLDNDARELQLAAEWAEAHAYDACVLAFELPVKSADFYAVEVGRRGELTYSHDELESVGWFVTLELG